MKALSLRLIVVSAMAIAELVAQNPPQTTATQDHFRWSQDFAHELDYKHTLSKTPDISPELRSALSRQIRRELIRILRKHGDLDDESPEDLKKLVADTRIELIDLNGDGKPEIIAQANGLGPCGATGNCSWLVFEETPSGLKLLLETTWGYELITVRSWSTNGFRDIVLAAHVSAAERTLDLFKFDGSKYRTDSCYFHSYIGDNGEFLKTPWVSRTRCDTTP
jgi:hypothetical protein